MLIVLEIVVSIFLIGLILLQAKDAGLSGGASYSTRRGVEKFVFIGTIILAALFALLSIGLLVLP